MTEIATHSKRTLHCPRNGNIMPNISFVLAGKQHYFAKWQTHHANKSGDTFFYFQIWAHPKAGENRKLKESLSWQKLNSAVVEILLEFSESQVCAQKSCSPKQYLCHPKVIFFVSLTIIKFILVHGDADDISEMMMILFSIAINRDKENDMQRDCNH